MTALLALGGVLLVVGVLIKRADDRRCNFANATADTEETA